MMECDLNLITSTGQKGLIVPWEMFGLNNIGSQLGLPDPHVI